MEESISDSISVCLDTRNGSRSSTDIRTYGVSTDRGDDTRMSRSVYTVSPARNTPILSVNPPSFQSSLSPPSSPSASPPSPSSPSSSPSSSSSSSCSSSLPSSDYLPSQMPSTKSIKKSTIHSINKSKAVCKEKSTFGPFSSSSNALNQNDNKKNPKHKSDGNSDILESLIHEPFNDSVLDETYQERYRERMNTAEKEEKKNRERRIKFDEKKERSDIGRTRSRREKCGKNDKENDRGVSGRSFEGRACRNDGDDEGTEARESRRGYLDRRGEDNDDDSHGNDDGDDDHNNNGDNNDDNDNDNYRGTSNSTHGNKHNNENVDRYEDEDGDGQSDTPSDDSLERPRRSRLTDNSNYHHRDGVATKGMDEGRDVGDNVRESLRRGEMEKRVKRLKGNIEVTGYDSQSVKSRSEAEKKKTNNSKSYAIDEIQQDANDDTQLYEEFIRGKEDRKDFIWAADYVEKSMDDIAEEEVMKGSDLAHVTKR